MKSQSRTFQDRATAAQNFFKHGFNNLSGSVPLDTIVTDATLLVCLFCHKDLHLEVTSLIQLFWFRLLVEQPELLALYDADPFAERSRLEKLRG